MKGFPLGPAIHFVLAEGDVQIPLLRQVQQTPAQYLAFEKHIVGH